MKNPKIIKHDSAVHHPLGAGSYVFRKNYVDYIINCCPEKRENIVSIGAQPNSYPHFGTIFTFATAFSLAKALNEKGKQTTILLELVNTAVDQKIICNSIPYQKSLDKTGKSAEFLPVYRNLLENLRGFSGVEFAIRKQNEFNENERVKEIIRRIIEKNTVIGKLMAPTTECLSFRSSCPQCGWADKNGINNKYYAEKIVFRCFEHGEYEINFIKSSELQNLEYNTPLRNLLKGLLYAEENMDEGCPRSWIRVTGSDYAGAYQEQTFYKAISILKFGIENLPHIVYAPLITDWSGAKLSKSLYVKENAYGYLIEQGLEYFVNSSLVDRKKLAVIYQIVKEMITESPYKMFRNYSVNCFAEMIEDCEKNEKFLAEEVNTVLRSG